jgi:hypothetical protein
MVVDRISLTAHKTISRMVVSACAGSGLEHVVKVTIFVTDMAVQPSLRG